MTLDLLERPRCGVHRYYDPSTSQFLSADPAVASTGEPYAYVDGNPVNEADPLGLWGWNPFADVIRAAKDVGHAIASGGRAASNFFSNGTTAQCSPRLSGSISLDTNILIYALEHGQMTAVTTALSGRTPEVSPTALVEFGAGGGNISAATVWVHSLGGTIGPPGSISQAQSLVLEANQMGRSLSLADALIASSAIQSGVPLLTADKQLYGFLQATGRRSELYSP
ncbi:MAG TPA: RHS repeat-associated core domain-containing protein [Acidimicrobiales bacterium]|nr:RHS repeat-associated core domain-containing protein [Acidimicrobiales bacterium]